MCAPPPLSVPSAIRGSGSRRDHLKANSRLTDLVGKGSLWYLQLWQDIRYTQFQFSSKTTPFFPLLFRLLNLLWATQLTYQLLPDYHPKSCSNLFKLVQISEKKVSESELIIYWKIKKKDNQSFLIQPLTFHQVRTKKTIKYKKILTLKQIKIKTFSKTLQYVPKLKNTIYINGGNCRIQKKYFVSESEMKQ
jgi:hypothetical protein